MRLALMLGTKNPGKVVEIRSILAGIDLDLIPLTDLPDAPEVVEDGLTYRANALKKARTVATWSGRLTLAEDSGLEVAALGGAPGIYTARFGGPGLTSRERCLYLLERLQEVPLTERQAMFRCVAVLADPAGHTLIREGRCGGMIGDTLRGEEGFGYDPLFILPELGRTMAELEPAQKDRVSHRAQAIRVILPGLLALAQGQPWSTLSCEGEDVAPL